jgi:alanine racemase
VRTFFVALPHEGATLREAVGREPLIYVLAGYPPAGSEAEPPLLYATHDLRPVLNSAAQAGAWLADRPGAPCAVHVDTGMNRLGMPPAEFAGLGPLPEAVRLVISHYACADAPDHPLNARQRAAFAQFTQAIDRPRSLANTGGILLGPDSHFDLTRAGVGLYGGLPFAEARRAVTLHVPVLQVREIAAGASVGYGGDWTASAPARIATIAAGYADGLPRSLGNPALGAPARAFLGSRPLPFAGRVSMDLITLDATGCPDAVPGAMVELIGPNQGVDDLATAAGTIGYEILTSLGSRYTRRYTGT